jgi:hypothetical protein
MSATTDKTVITEEIGDKGIITLNRPKALNAINLDMVRLVIFCFLIIAYLEHFLHFPELFNLHKNR